MPHSDEQSTVNHDPMLARAALSEERCFHVSSIQGRGRGVVATTDIPKDALIFATQPDITVLYSAFGGSTCAHCFCEVPEAVEGAAGGTGASPERASCAAVSANDAPAFYCPGCDQFVLCGACVESVCDEVRKVNANDTSAVNPEAASLTEAARWSLLYRHPLLRTHALACAWYNELPAAVRAKGLDTDMLRFCLEYGARAFYAHSYTRLLHLHCLRVLHKTEAVTRENGPKRKEANLEAVEDAVLHCTEKDDEAVQSFARQFVENIATLDVMDDSQSAETLHFCTVFARDKIVKTFGPRPDAAAAAAAPPPPSSSEAPSSTSGVPRFPVTAEALREVLLRTQVNSLGFPFTSEETLGWSLERTVCMLNHSCLPNAAVVRVPAHDMACPKATADADKSDASAVPPETCIGGAWIGVRALQDIPSGEEITISYVDLITYGEDVRERTRTLLERYRFLCSCSRCLRQRAAVQQKNAVLGKKKFY